MLPYTKTQSQQAREILLLLRRCKLPCFEKVTWLRPEGNSQKLRAIPGQQVARKQKPQSDKHKELNSANNSRDLRIDPDLWMRTHPNRHFDFPDQWDPEQKTSISIVTNFLIYRKCEIINGYYFKILNLWLFVLQILKLLSPQPLPRLIFRMVSHSTYHSVYIFYYHYFQTTEFLEVWHSL